MPLDAARIWVKTPSAMLTIGLHWDDVIDRGDALASCTWTVPAGLSKEAEALSASAMTDDGETYPAGEVALVRLSGGTVDTDYTIQCVITTAAGDIDERSITVAVRDR